MSDFEKSVNDFIQLVVVNLDGLIGHSLAILVRCSRVCILMCSVLRSILTHDDFRKFY